MAILITSYWGESTTEDLQLRRLYDSARDNLAPRYNKDVAGALEVIDLDWLPDEAIEDFLIRGSSADDPADVERISELAELLNQERNARPVGTGIALYGLHSASYAAGIRQRIDNVRPKGLRLLAGEPSVDSLARHLQEWMDQAASTVIARASLTPSERFIDRLSIGRPETAGQPSWEMM